MYSQFFGKPFLVVFGSLAATFLIAIAVFQTGAATWALGLIGLGTLILTIKRLEYGIMIVFAELFANSHGHLIDALVGSFPLSLRMTVFLAVMAGWFVSVLLKRVPLRFPSPTTLPFVVLLAWACIALVIGGRANGWGESFGDGNAYFFFSFLFPILSVNWTNDNKRLLFQALTASALWVAGLSLGLLYVFTHLPEWMLSKTYTFIRDTRTGELTKMKAGFFRIFLQAQISILVSWFYLASIHLNKEKITKKSTTFFVVFTTFVAVTIIGLSRSFWVGTVAGVVAMIAAILLVNRSRVKQLFHQGVFHLLTVPASLVFIALVMFFPLPYRTGSFSDLTSLVSERSTNASDAAVSSRWNLLPPLMEKIKAHPLLGSGFGTSVTYLTDDPRVRAFSPDGTWTTTSLEWGWQELWLKMGILGPLLFLWIAIATAKALWNLTKTPHAWIGFAGIGTLVFLYVTHIFSPYLNHPLGIGTLLFFVPFFETPKSFKEFVASCTVRMPRVPVATTAYTTRQIEKDVSEV